MNCGQLRTLRLTQNTFTYARKKLKTKINIGPFRINEEIFNTAQDICGRTRVVSNWKTSTS